MISDCTIRFWTKIRDFRTDLFLPLKKSCHKSGSQNIIHRKRELILKKKRCIYFVYQTLKLPDRKAKHGVDITAAADERTVIWSKQIVYSCSIEVCSIRSVILFQPVNRCFCIGKIFSLFLFQAAFVLWERQILAKSLRFPHTDSTITTERSTKQLLDFKHYVPIKLEDDW